MHWFYFTVTKDNLGKISALSVTNTYEHPFSRFSFSRWKRSKIYFSHILFLRPEVWLLNRFFRKFKVSSDSNVVAGFRPIFQGCIWKKTVSKHGQTKPSTFFHFFPLFFPSRTSYCTQQREKKKIEYVRRIHRLWARRRRNGWKL